MNNVIRNNLVACILVFAVLSLGIVNQASADIFADANLVGYWQFGRDANDSSYYGNDGTFVGDANANKDILHLDGNNDYVSVSSLDGAFSSNDTFTVTGWFKTSQTTGIQTIVGQWMQANPYSVHVYFGWQVLVENYVIIARFGNNQTYTTEITGTSNAADFTWHHFALVYPTSSSNTKLYLDGVSEGTPGTRSFSSSGMGATTKFRIGDGSYAAMGTPILKGGPFNGTIDDVMIYDRTLEEWEIRQLYNEANKAYGYFNKVQADVLKGSTCSASEYYNVSLGYKTTAISQYDTALGSYTTASGGHSTAIGHYSTASGGVSVAAGYGPIASGYYSTAIGTFVTASNSNSIALGKYSTNNIENSLTVGYGYGSEQHKVDFRVRSGLVNVYGDLDVSQKVTMATLVLPVKTTTGDPANPVEGQIYVNTADNKVRVYADGAWRNLATW